MICNIRKKSIIQNDFYINFIVFKAALQIIQQSGDNLAENAFFND